MSPTRNSPRSGIAACATGLAQCALDAAVAHAQERTTFGRRIIDHQGWGFLLADMAAAVDSARATYLDAARRRDAGLSYSRQAGVAELIATDAAMKVTADAVQAWAVTDTPATIPSNATCAKRRSRRSSRAPTRSSASSSAAN